MHSKKLCFTNSPEILGCKTALNKRGGEKYCIPLSLKITLVLHQESSFLAGIVFTVAYGRFDIDFHRIRLSSLIQPLSL